MRFFNTAGPVNCEDHYCLPPLERFDLADILSLIEQKKYFVLHAPRQTGKTSALLAFMEHLNLRGPYRALYANLEVGQSAREDVAAGMRAIVNEIASRARDFLSLEATLAEGVVQTWEYADRCGAAEAHLVIFDRTPDKPWEKKIFRREEAIQGRPITVWGM